MSDERRGGGATRSAVTAAAASYLANAAFGTAVATGVIDSSRIRWVHHALFVATMSLTTVALAAGVIERRPAGLALAPALAPLAVLPYLSGGVGRHAAVAGAATPAFVTGLVLAWRRR